MKASTPDDVALALQGMTPEEARNYIVINKKRLIALARQDVNTFASYVMRDEKTGLPFEQAPYHQDWHNLIDIHDHVIIWSHIESGKTNQLAIARSLWMLGRDPAMRIVVVSNTKEQAAKIVRTLARYIEKSRELVQVFPNLRKAEPWMPSSQLTIRRPTVSKDPSVQAFGVHGNVTGARVDYLLLDDILDYENVKSQSARDDLWDWYHNALAGRLTENAKVVSTGVAQHPDDLQHRFANREGWPWHRFPVLNKEGQSAWPARWSLARIEGKRQGPGAFTAIEFARQMLCIARDDEEARFKKDWVDLCMARGKNLTPIYSLPQLPEGMVTYTGVDLAVQRHSAADRTVLFTIMVHPNGDREVLSCESGKWAAPDILRRIRDTHRRYHSIIWVENNAAQDYLVQILREGPERIPVKGITTGRQKAHPEFGIEGIANEMSEGKWIIPTRPGKMGKELEEWIQELLFYDPREHTGDRLMASWFAREGARLTARKSPTFEVNIIRGRSVAQSAQCKVCLGKQLLCDLCGEPAGKCTEDCLVGATANCWACSR